MPIPNEPPQLTDVEVVKSIAFPFRLGKSSFPEMATVETAVKYRIYALLLTGKNDLVMNCDVGTNVHTFIFENMSELMKARLALDVASAIQKYEPEAKVITVQPKAFEEKDGSTTTIIDIIYRVGNQVVEQQVPVPPSAGGL